MGQLRLEEVKKIPPKVLLRLINRAKEALKSDETMKEVCSKYNINIDFIDDIPIRFADLDVSAKTDHGVVLLNYKLLCDGDFLKDKHYILHETIHVLQQTLKDKPTQSANDGDYLHNPFEQEGFQYQVKYLDDQYGPQESDRYVKQVLDHHDKGGKERKELEEKLKAKI